MSEHQNCEGCGKPVAPTSWFCGGCWRDFKTERVREAAIPRAVLDPEEQR